jgi:hypothetical protein
MCFVSPGDSVLDVISIIARVQELELRSDCALNLYKHDQCLLVVGTAIARISTVTSELLANDLIPELQRSVAYVYFGRWQVIS